MFVQTWLARGSHRGMLAYLFSPQVEGTDVRSFGAGGPTCTFDAHLQRQAPPPHLPSSSSSFLFQLVVFASARQDRFRLPRNAGRSSVWACARIPLESRRVRPLTAAPAPAARPPGEQPRFLRHSEPALREPSGPSRGPGFTGPFPSGGRRGHSARQPGRARRIHPSVEERGAQTQQYVCVCVWGHCSTDGADCAPLVVSHPSVGVGTVGFSQEGGSSQDRWEGTFPSNRPTLGMLERNPGGRESSSFY